MILPFIATTSGEAFRAVPRDMKQAALALGINRWKLVTGVLFPAGAGGMIAAVVLALARALGETLAVVMLAGNSVAPPESLLDRGQPITALIVTELGEAGAGSSKYHALFAAALLLSARDHRYQCADWPDQTKGDPWRRMISRCGASACAGGRIDPWSS